MKKPRLAKKFLEELQKTPILSAVCKALNISRQTIYRWIEEDSEFREKYEECLRQGTDNINDLAESKMISAIDRGEKWAILGWLSNHKNNYIKPRPEDYFDQITSRSEIGRRISEFSRQKNAIADIPTGNQITFVDFSGKEIELPKDNKNEIG